MGAAEHRGSAGLAAGAETPPTVGRSLAEGIAPADVRQDLDVDGRQVRPRLAALLGDIRYQIEHRVASADEIAIAFHHRLVVIHPFPNGNGCHARLEADVLVEQLGGFAFPWGGTASFMETTELRAAYIDALRCADRGDLELLLAFARMA